MARSRHKPSRLEKIQRWVQTVITHPDGVLAGMATPEARRQINVDPHSVEKVVERSRTLNALERLAIYGNAYFGRLLECLREEFPVLMRALGQDTFDAFALGYLQAYPPRSYSLIHLGQNLPRYLAETRPANAGRNKLPATWPEFVIDLATLELAITEVFDGPGSEGEQVLDQSVLAGIAAERLAELRLQTAPCLRVLALRYPVHKYFTAVRRKKNPRFPKERQTFVAISRVDYVVRHYELSLPAYHLLDALIQNETVGVAIEHALSAAGGEKRLAYKIHRWFHDWAAEGFFKAIVS